MVDVNPLSAADNIAFTLNDSATLSLSFLQNPSDSGKAGFLFLLPILYLLKFLVVVKEVFEPAIYRTGFSLPCPLLCLHRKIQKRLPVFMKRLIQQTEVISLHHDFILSNCQLIHLIKRCETQIPEAVFGYFPILVFKT